MRPSTMAATEGSMARSTAARKASKLPSTREPFVALAYDASACALNEPAARRDGSLAW